MRTPALPRRPSRLRLILRLGAGFAVLTLGLGWFLLRHVAPSAIVEPPRQGVGAPVPEGIQTRQFEVGGTLSLNAWQANPVNRDRPRAIILVLHGISDSKCSQAGRLHDLARQDILAIAPDLRAHGDSGGLASYGYHERNDLAAIRKTLSLEHPGVPIGLWGTSYGAACGLQALAVDPGFDFGIIESTFADLTEMGRQQVANHTSLPLAWTASVALSEAGKRASFDPDQLSPERAMAQVSVPVLHLHGESDDVIPIAHAHRIAAHARQATYRFVSIPGGDHFHLRQADPVTYDREIAAFLAELLPWVDPLQP